MQNSCTVPKVVNGGVHVKDFNRIKKSLEARGGIEPPMKVLQTFALPLGDRASARRAVSNRALREIEEA
jgi:hypothetical protein